MNFLTLFSLLTTSLFGVYELSSSNEYSNNTIVASDLATTESSTASVQKFFYSENDRLYKSGFMKGEVKDSTWITMFEDYPLPAFELYRNGASVKGEFSFNLKDDKGRAWAKGKLLTKPEFTAGNEHKSLGHINFFQYDADQHTIQSFYAAGSSYESDKDSLVVITRLYTSKTNKLIWKSATLHWNTEEFKPISNLDSLERALNIRP